MWAWDVIRSVIEGTVDVPVDLDVSDDEQELTVTKEWMELMTNQELTTGKDFVPPHSVDPSPCPCGASFGAASAESRPW